MQNQWTAWFDDFATAAAARRHLTTHWVGPKVQSRTDWSDSQIRCNSDGRWQIRLREADHVTAAAQQSKNF